MTYQLPDGNIDTVGVKRFRHAEVLFSQRNPRRLFPKQHGTRRLHPQEFVRQCCVVERHEREHVPKGFGAHDDGADGVGSIFGEDQGGCSTRRE